MTNSISGIAMFFFIIIPVITAFSYILTSIIVAVSITVPSSRLTVIIIMSYLFLFLDAQDQKNKERRLNVDHFRYSAEKWPARVQFK